MVNYFLYIKERSKLFIHSMYELFPLSATKFNISIGIQIGMFFPKPKISLYMKTFFGLQCKQFWARCLNIYAYKVKPLGCKNYQYQSFNVYFIFLVSRWYHLVLYQVIISCQHYKMYVRVVRCRFAWKVWKTFHSFLLFMKLLLWMLFLQISFCWVNNNRWNDGPAAVKCYYIWIMTAKGNIAWFFYLSTMQ